MRAHEFVTEAAKPPAGFRADKHVEDAVILDGSTGAIAMIDSLAEMGAAEAGEGDITVKWDGQPAVMFGRNEQGEFVFTIANNFKAKGYNGKPTSADELRNNLTRTSQDEERLAFADSMAKAFAKTEPLVPEYFRGYFKADILFLSEPPVVDGDYEFTPQIVTYNIPTDSDIGERIKGTSLGMAVHFATDLEGEKDASQRPGEVLQSVTDVFITGPVSLLHTPKVDMDKIQSAKSFVVQHAAAMDKMFAAAAATPGLKDFKSLLNRFVSDQTPNFTNMMERFVQYIADAKHISAPKTAKIIALVEQHEQGFQSVFEVIDMIMEVKDEIIDDLDSVSPVKTSIAGKRGGEGYMKKDKFKMVPRKHFTAANRAKQR